MFASSVPCQDDWVLVPMADKFLNGGSIFLDCWQRYNEHRHFFSRVLMVTGAAWTNWNPAVMGCVDLAVVLAASWALAGLASKIGERRFGRAEFFWTVVIFSLCARAAKTTAWLSMMSFYLAVSLAVISLAMVSSQPEARRNWFIGTLLGIASSWTLAGGLMVWPAALPILGSVRKRAIFLFAAAVWVMGAVLAAVPIFYGKEAMQIGMALDIRSVFQTILIFLAGIFYPLPLLPFGILACALGIWAAARCARASMRGDAAASGMLSVLLFVALNGAAVALTRRSYGALYAANDRYVTISCWFWAVVAVMLVIESSRSRLVSSAVPLLAASLLVMVPSHWQNSAQCRQILDETGTKIRAGSLTREEAVFLYPDPRAVREAIPVLKSRKWAMFRDEDIS